jgi:hypothetical protein
MAQKVSQRAAGLPGELLVDDGVQVDDAFFDGNQYCPGSHWFTE